MLEYQLIWTSQYSLYLLFILSGYPPISEQALVVCWTIWSTQTILTIVKKLSHVVHGRSLERILAGNRVRIRAGRRSKATIGLIINPASLVSLLIEVNDAGSNEGPKFKRYGSELYT